MKSFSNMSQGDLIIIRDALKETIKRQTEVRLFTDESSILFSQQQQKYIDKMANRLHDIGNKFTRIGELLIAIDEALGTNQEE
ncbi:MAG: hypothetical protein NTW10_11300 [Bacteroidetes bacterium]|nr:hypothetical protein [Bacteroidota bacterium]